MQKKQKNSIIYAMVGKRKIKISGGNQANFFK